MKNKRGTRLQVFRGKKERTSGGLTKKDLMKNKRGKIISKKAHKKGRALINSGIGKWSKAVMKARKNLGITGFCAVKKGTKLYKMVQGSHESKEESWNYWILCCEKRNQ